jgi:hypothetical protein
MRNVLDKRGVVAYHAWQLVMNRFVVHMRRFLMGIGNAVVLGLTSLVLLASISHAGPVELWPYEKLFKNATLVVVVKPLATREATAKDKAVPPHDYHDYLTGVVTRFKVIVVVKGEYKDKDDLNILHFRLKTKKEGGRRWIIDTPWLASFPNKESNDDYLLFLKKGKDGRMEFVSGQLNPALSVKSSSLFLDEGEPGSKP